MTHTVASTAADTVKTSDSPAINLPPGPRGSKLADGLLGIEIGDTRDVAAGPLHAELIDAADRRV